jgi:hypothetical protein
MQNGYLKSKMQSMLNLFQNYTNKIASLKILILSQRQELKKHSVTRKLKERKEQNNMWKLINFSKIILKYSLQGDL